MKIQKDNNIMQDKWNQAAQKCEAAEEAKQKEVKAGLTTMVVNKVLKKESEPTDVQLGIQELNEFMANEGHSAMNLLRQTKRHINFGQDYDGGRYGKVYLIDGGGLQVSTEAMGTWMIYSKNVTPPVLEPITAEHAIMAAVKHERIKPTEVVTWLRTQLNAIADEVLAEK